MVEGTSLLRKHMGLNLYREFESLRLRQKYQNARASGLFVFYVERAMSLRTSRERFEGLGLQAKQRPAACRRTLRLRQKYQNARASGLFVFLCGASDVPADTA